MFMAKPFKANRKQQLWGRFLRGERLDRRLWRKRLEQL